MIVLSDSVTPSSLLGYSQAEKLQIYNCMDSALTAEIHAKLLPMQDEKSKLVYRYQRAMMAPALTMMRRGVRVNPGRAQELAFQAEQRCGRFYEQLQKLSFALWDRGLESKTSKKSFSISDKKLKTLLYEALGIPPKLKRNADDEWVPSVDRERLEILHNEYMWLRPLIGLVLAVRDESDTISVLRSGADPDGRLRCSFNIGGTETLRWSSSKAVSGRGTNLQNITKDLREIFIPDEGYKFANFDLKQADSYTVAYESGDQAYIDAIESGDIHTFVCRMVWGFKTRQEADRKYYRHFTYRDIAKRGGHAANFLGTPHGLSHKLKVPVGLLEDFFRKYFEAFPEIPRWQQKKAADLQTWGFLENSFGHRRYFFGRRDDRKTIGEAVAFVPQSNTAVILNNAICAIHRKLDPHAAQVLLQVHDSVLVQFPPLAQSTLVPQILKLMKIPVNIGPRTMTIPTDAMVGWNWGEFNEEEGKNPSGLRKWGKVDVSNPFEHRPRVLCESKETALLHRRISEVHGGPKHY